VLRKGGLTAAGVIAAIHRRRVLSLAKRRLPLWEMTAEADLECSRMSSDPLPVDDLHGRVAVALRKPDASALSQPLMRPDRGCVTLVSVRSFFLLASDCPWSSRPRLFVCLQKVGCHTPSWPPVPEDAVNRAARRVAAEKRKEKKDAKKARARERTQARDALEKLRRWQERDGLPREPSPETPEDDEDDDEDDDMAARLGLIPGLRLGQESSSQPPSGLAPSVPGARTPGSRFEERGQTEGSSRAACSLKTVARAGCAGGRSSGHRGSVWAVRLPGVWGAQGEDGTESGSEADLDGAFGGQGSRFLPTGTVDHGSEWVSTLGCLRLSSSFVCPDPDFPFLFSKRSHGLTDLAPRKVLKTASASTAGATPGLADQLTFSQDAPQRGAQAAPVAVERVPEAGSSVEAAVALGEAAGVAVASGPLDMPPALAPAAVLAVAVPAVERPVAADAAMAETSLLDVSEEGGVEPRPVPPSGSLVPARRSSEGRRQFLRFRTREASDPFFVLDDEREEHSWDELRECAEATVGSLRSSLEVFSRDVPKILQVMISGIPFS
jgi:hypothetical protein